MKSYILHRNTHITAAIGILIALIIMKFDAISGTLSSITLISALQFLFFTFLFSSITIFAKNEIAKRFPETSKGLGVIAVIMFLTMLLSYYLYTMNGTHSNTDYQTTIALLISSVLVGSGWWVQAVISKVASRKAHTINTLMTQRNSELFYEKNKSISKEFGFKKTLNENLAKKTILPDHIDVKDKKIKQPFIEPARNVLYILNYYEFICAGINNGDFDTHLIEDCLSNIIVDLEVRYFHYIKIARDNDGKCSFENIIKVVDQWSSSGSMILRQERGEQLGNITLVFNNDDEYLE
ncbi:DUF4760 domain-containing protein [Erwinia rhapontici]|uniref:DUF4760 domain-containing protein n=1 Tax=Erwinia rhapontici TaxID=55212 RepID=UPI0013318432|nr:DUF4760 domain-containing protein [Erwinia rhapontici]MBP2157206.1 hypothetical protein [Erwinia rhapontici]